jgi:hypothetical protein
MDRDKPDHRRTGDDRQQRFPNFHQKPHRHMQFKVLYVPTVQRIPIHRQRAQIWPFWAISLHCSTVRLAKKADMWMPP